jgi:hypothetical protein
MQPFPVAQLQQQQKVQQPQFGPDLAVRLICPECRDPTPSIEEEFSSGDLVCKSCGLVLGDRIVDTRSEWRVSLKSLMLLVCIVLDLSTDFRRPSQTTKVTTPRVSALSPIP